MMRRLAARPGFSLIELIVAVVAAGGLLTATWSWFWTLSGCVGHGADAAEAYTSLAFARRLLLRELRGAASLTAPAVGVGCSARSLALVPGAEEPSGLVQYAWDPARQVLWRASSSNHVADGVTDFAIGYLDGDGEPVTPAAGDQLAAAQLRAVRSLTLRIRLRSGGATAAGDWVVALRCAP